MQIVNEIYDAVVARDPEQPEFHQAVWEVLESLTLRSVFYPLLGERVWGWWGHAIDIIAVFATLFGLATSLGFGTQQALAGFNYLYDWGTGGYDLF